MKTPATVLARYILDRLGYMDAYSIHKLLFLAQSHHLHVHDKRLFDEEIEARTYGPVVPSVYQHHQGLFVIKPFNFPLPATALLPRQRNSCDFVVDRFGKMTGAALGEITKDTRAYVEARRRNKPASGAYPVIFVGHIESFGAQLDKYVSRVGPYGRCENL